VTNPTMTKVMCACLLARGVHVWSTEAIVDGEVKVKDTTRNMPVYDNQFKS
jgi:hypothetical protein